MINYAESTEPKQTGPSFYKIFPRGKVENKQHGVMGPCRRSYGTDIGSNRKRIKDVATFIEMFLHLKIIQEYSLAFKPSSLNIICIFELFTTALLYDTWHISSRLSTLLLQRKFYVSIPKSLDFAQHSPPLLLLRQEKGHTCNC